MMLERGLKAIILL